MSEEKVFPPLIGSELKEYVQEYWEFIDFYKEAGLKIDSKIAFVR